MVITCDNQTYQLFAACSHEKPPTFAGYLTKVEGLVFFNLNKIVLKLTIYHYSLS